MVWLGKAAKFNSFSHMVFAFPNQIIFCVQFYFSINIKEMTSESNRLDLNLSKEADLAGMEKVITTRREEEEEEEEEEGNNNGKEKKLWSDEMTFVLIDKFQEIYLDINRGNFRAKDWAKLAREVNVSLNKSFSASQCKYKWENLKKRFKQENSRQDKRCGKPCKWPLYEAMTRVVGSSHPNPNPMEDSGSDSDGDAGQTPSTPFRQEPCTITNTKKRRYDEGHIGGKRLRSRERESESEAARDRERDSLAEAIGSGLALLAQTMKEIELKRMEQMDRMLDVHLQIAKLFAPRRGSSP